MAGKKNSKKNARKAKAAAATKLEAVPKTAVPPKDMAEKIDDLDRALLEAANNAVLVQANAIAALDAETRNLQTQMELVQTRKAEAQRIGMEKQKVLQELGNDLRERYNIPDTHDINIADGAVIEKAPQQPMPGAPMPQGAPPQG